MQIQERCHSGGLITLKSLAAPAPPFWICWVKRSAVLRDSVYPRTGNMYPETDSIQRKVDRLHPRTDGVNLGNHLRYSPAATDNHGEFTVTDFIATCV